MAEDHFAIKTKARIVVGRREESLMLCHPGSELRLLQSIGGRDERRAKIMNGRSKAKQKSFFS